MTLFSVPRPAVVGHRGAPADAPENSPEAFAAAATAGATWVELDARFSSDGIVVVHHDPQTDDGVPLGERTAAELHEVGVWRLDTILDGLPAELGVDVEVKNAPIEPGYHEDGSLARTVASMVGHRMEQRRFCTSSFNPYDVAEMAGALPDVPAGQLYQDSLPTESAIAIAREHGARILCAPVGGLDRDGLLAAHAAGLEVLVWTVNDLDHAMSLADWGVEAICTDDPQGLAQRLTAR